MRPPLASVAALALLAAGAALGHGGEDHSKPDDAAGARPAVAAPAGLDAPPQRLADGSLFVPKASQRQMAVRTAPAVVAEHAPAFSLNGRVVADPNAGGRVQASQSGRVEAPSGGFPALGQKVRRGEVLAWLRPVASSIERGNQRARLAELGAQHAIAEKRLARLAALAGSVPQKDIEAAREDLASLAASRQAVAASLEAREALTAPVAGVVSSMSVAAGQVVEARETLFEIVDPARLAVEATAFDAAQAADIAAATVRLPGGTSASLAFAGAGRALREQAIPVFFRFRGAAPALAVGQPVTVLASGATRTRGVALPVRAVARDAANRGIVWVHESAERFVPRQVRAEPLDGARVLVREGLAEGERVVVDGAALLAQVR